MTCPGTKPSLAFLLLMFSAWAGPRPVEAQAAGNVDAPVPEGCARVAPGDRVSVRTVDPQGRWIGTLVRYDGEALVIGRGGTEEVLPVRSVSEARVECRLAVDGEARSGRGFTRGFLIGGLATAAVITFLAWDSAGAGMAPFAFIAGAVPGGVIGGLVGAGPGEERRWVDWDLTPERPAPATATASPGLVVTPHPFAPDAWSVGVSLPLPRR